MKCPYPNEIVNRIVASADAPTPMATIARHWAAFSPRISRQASQRIGRHTMVKTRCSIVTSWVAWRTGSPPRCWSSGARNRASVPQSIAASATSRTAKRSITQ